MDKYLNTLNSTVRSVMRVSRKRTWFYAQGRTEMSGQPASETRISVCPAMCYRLWARDHKSGDEEIAKLGAFITLQLGPNCNLTCADSLERTLQKKAPSLTSCDVDG